MTTWRAADISFPGEFTVTRGVFLSGGLDANVKNVMVSRCPWLPLASPVLSGGVIKKERESSPRSSHAGSLARHTQGLFHSGILIHPRNSVVAGDGAQQVALPVAAPSASGSHSGLWPLPP